MTWWTAVARWVGAVLSEIVTALAEQWRKPRGVEMHGGDKEVQSEIDQQIERDALRSMGGTRIGPDGPDGVRRTGTH